MIFAKIVFSLLLTLLFLVGDGSSEDTHFSRVEFSLERFNQIRNRRNRTRAAFHRDLMQLAKCVSTVHRVQTPLTPSEPLEATLTHWLSDSYWSSPWIRKNGIHSFDKQTSTRLLEFEVAIYQPDSNGNYRESSLRSDGPQMFSFSDVSRKAISRLWICMFYWSLDCPNGHIAYIGYFALPKTYVNHIELNVKTFEVERKKRTNIL